MIQLKASIRLLGPDKLAAITKAVNEADGWGVEVGWKGDARYPDGGPRVAQVAIFNELGTYDQDGNRLVPARPFIRPAYDKNKSAINRMRVQAIQNVAFHGMPRERALAAFGYQMQEFIRNEIKSGDHTPNAPSVTARKRREGRPMVPLIHTRLMLDSLGFWVVHNDGDVKDGGELRESRKAAGAATRAARKEAKGKLKRMSSAQLNAARDALVAKSRAHAKEMLSRARERSKVRKEARRVADKSHRAVMAMRKKDRDKLRREARKVHAAKVIKAAFNKRKLARTTKAEFGKRNRASAAEKRRYAKAKGKILTASEAKKLATTAVKKAAVGIAKSGRKIGKVKQSNRKPRGSK